MIERGEWVRCDAALDAPDRRAAEIAATGDWRNLRRCEKHLAFLDGHRQRGWAVARERGWTRVADARYPDVSRNLCPRHAHTPLAALVLMPLRTETARAVENVALALLDAATEGHALAAQLSVHDQRAGEERFAHPAHTKPVSGHELAELRQRADRHEALRRTMQEEPRER